MQPSNNENGDVVEATKNSPVQLAARHAADIIGRQGRGYDHELADELVSGRIKLDDRQAELLLRVMQGFEARIQRAERTYRPFPGEPRLRG